MLKALKEWLTEEKGQGQSRFTKQEPQADRADMALRTHLCAMRKRKALSTEAFELEDDEQDSETQRKPKVFLPYPSVLYLGILMI